MTVITGLKEEELLLVEPLLAAVLGAAISIRTRPLDRAHPETDLASRLEESGVQILETLESADQTRVFSSALQALTRELRRGRPGSRLVS